jgi:hypothetical protein
MTDRPRDRRALLLGGGAAAGWLAAGPARAADAPRDAFNVREFGALGDGTGDDTAGFDAAIAAASAVCGEVVVPPPPGGFYRVNAATLLGNVAIVGLGPGTGDGASIPLRASNPETDIFDVPDGIDNWRIENLSFIEPSRNGIHFRSRGKGTIQGRVANCFFNGSAEACIAIDGQFERTLFEKCWFGGAQYGIYFSGRRTGAAKDAIFDGIKFIDCHWTGYRKNAVYANALDGTGGCLFLSCHATNYGKGESCIHVPAGARLDQSWEFLGFYGEACCGGAQSYAVTKGSIAKGSNLLAVASAEGLEAGRKVTVQGADTQGADLHTAIAGISGATVTLADKAMNEVADADVAMADYCIFDMTPANGSGAYAQPVFINCNGGNDHALYFSNCDGTYINCSHPRPVHPYRAPLYGGSTILGRGLHYRSPAQWASNFFGGGPGGGNSLANRNCDLSMTGFATHIGTPPGGHFWVTLAHRSEADRTYGDFAVYNDSGTALLTADGDGARLRTSGSVLTRGIELGKPSGPQIVSGAGAPAAPLPAGSLYIRTDGETGARLYVSAGGGSWNAVAGV